MIPESFIQELLQRIDIVDLIDGYVPLKKAGANYAACCPFHNEKSPSFTVSPTKQFYHCFGCGAHGTAIGFVMEYSGQGFVDTIKELSSRVGLQVPEQEGRSRDERQGTVALIEVMALAAKYYREQLKHSSKAIDYLKRRGLTGEIAARFAIGYAPDGWQNLEAVFPNYSATELQAAGLVIKNEQGRLYDRFRDRVMFPIISQKGEVIAFGGRVLDAGEPKYLNSPETPLFEKGRELFGLPQARQCLRDKNVAVVVEGYMDVVALAQHGVNNALATLGTATTPTHIQKLFRQVDRVVFCFDGDAAGRKAAWRALENSLEALADDKTIGFVLLPAAEDPDSYVRAHGAGAFETLVLQATPLSDFLLRELAQQCDMTTAEGKARLVHEAKPLLTRLKTPLLRLQLVKRLAEASGFSQTEVERLCELKSFTAPAPRRVPRQKLSLARTVIRLILQKPELAMRLPAELVSDATAEGAALRYLCQTIGGEENLSTVVLLERLRGGEHEALMQGAAAELLQQPFAEEEIEAEFCGAVAQFELELINQRLEDFKRRAGALSAEEKQEYVQLLQQKGRWHRPSIPE